MNNQALRTGLVVGALALALPACQTVKNAVSSPVVVSANESQVVLRYNEGQGGEAQSDANRLCGNFGKKAQLREVVPSGANDRTVTYDCV